MNIAIDNYTSVAEEMPVSGDMENETQIAGDCLEPAYGVFDTYDFELAYYFMVREILFKGLSDCPEIRFTVFPSFKPESVLEISFDSEERKYYAVYHVCEQSIWNSDADTGNIRVIGYKAEIDERSVVLIRSVFTAAIAQTGFFKGRDLGIDGTNYCFSIFDCGLKSGTVWSPQEGRMKKLVDIGKTLVELVKSSRETIVIGDSVRRDAINLRARLIP